MYLPKPAKSHYSETEAAEILGVSVDELRSLIHTHITAGEDESAHPPMTAFQPSDLVLLRLLSESRRAAEVQTV